MWFFSTIFYLKGKSIKNILHLSYASEIANLVSFALWSEVQILGIPYFVIMMSLTLALNMIDKKKNK